MYSPERFTLAEACTLFGVAPVSEIPPADEITEETGHNLLDALCATVDLASAVIAEWNKIGGVAARVPSRHPHAD